MKICLRGLFASLSCIIPEECHRKTLLMLVEPSPDQIIKELRIVTAVLPALVHYQGDIDVDLDCLLGRLQKP